MTSTKKQVEVKDKIEGDMMDLSFLQLTEVPMKDTASYKKVRELDISTNRLVRLPPSMMTLTHLVKIDLSKNQLKELPENFGDLKKLKHLDLFSNQLKQLPLSFCELRELKFLDLKDNPLVPVLGEAAGDCVDARSCQIAAKRVVSLMSTLKEEVEKQLRKDKEKLERQEREEQEAEMRILEQKRREKKAEKERRRNQAKWSRPNEPTASGFEDSGFQEPPINGNLESFHRVQPTTSTILSRFTPSIYRIVTTSLVIFTAVTIARWNGPMTTENALKNVEKNYVAVRDIIVTLKGYSDGLYAFMSKIVMDLAKKWELDGAISKAQSVWGGVSGKMYDLLNSGYQATLQGFNLCWKQGNEILSRAIEYYRH